MTEGIDGNSGRQVEVLVPPVVVQAHAFPAHKLDVGLRIG